MPLKVQSRSNSLLIIQLNTGNTIHLAPGQAVQVSEYEISGNQKINKLRRSGIVAIAETPDVEGEESRKKPEKKSGKPSE